jgi:hypothetical protein
LILPIVHVYLHQPRDLLAANLMPLMYWRNSWALVQFFPSMTFVSYPPFTHRRRFYYDQELVENVADRDQSQEKRSGVFISAV